MVFLEREDHQGLLAQREAEVAQDLLDPRAPLASKEREDFREWQDLLDLQENQAVLETQDHLVQLERLGLLE